MIPKVSIVGHGGLSLVKDQVPFPEDEGFPERKENLIDGIEHLEHFHPDWNREAILG